MRPPAHIRHTGAARRIRLIRPDRRRGRTRSTHSHALNQPTPHPPPAPGLAHRRTRTHTHTILLACWRCHFYSRKSHARTHALASLSFAYNSHHFSPPIFCTTPRRSVAKRERASANAAPRAERVSEPHSRIHTQTHSHTHTHMRIHNRSPVPPWRVSVRACVKHPLQPHSSSQRARAPTAGARGPVVRLVLQRQPFVCGRAGRAVGCACDL